MEVDIINEFILGGSINNYDIYIYDFHSGLVCPSGVNPVSFPMGKPYYGNYILEAAGGNRLPYFGAFNVQGNVYYNPGGLKSIYVPFNNGWFSPESLQPPSCGLDIQVGAVQSNGAFGNTYVSSCGT